MNILIKSGVCLLLFSCAVLPQEAYNRLAVNWPKARDLSIVAHYTPTIDIQLDKEYNDNISSSDSMVALTDGIGYFSNYKLFKTYAIAGKKYRATLYGFCNCIAGKKDFFRPFLAVIDTEGDPLPINLIRHDIILFTEQYSSTLPLHTDFEWEFSVASTGFYKLLIYSNNSNMAAGVEDIDSKKYPGLYFKPTGDFMIVIQEE